MLSDQEIAMLRLRAMHRNPISTESVEGLLATLDAANSRERDALDEIRRLERAAEVWQKRYQELVLEPLPRLLWRRAVVLVARLLGGAP